MGQELRGGWLPIPRPSFAACNPTRLLDARKAITKPLREDVVPVESEGLFPDRACRALGGYLPLKGLAKGPLQIERASGALHMYVCMYV